MEQQDLQLELQGGVHQWHWPMSLEQSMWRWQEEWGHSI